MNISYSNNSTILENFLPKKIESAKIGLIYEIPLNMISFLENLFNKIKKTKSICLIVDYAKTKNFGNSLKSIKKQKIINPLKNIGNSDISTHVNFGLIKEISKKFNLASYGPINQKEFLIKNFFSERTNLNSTIVSSSKNSLLSSIYILLSSDK